MKKHLNASLAVGLIVLATGGLSRATGLVLTGVIDGPLTGGTPKAVELYAASDIPDLSIYGLGVANNGGGSDGIEFTFSPRSVSRGDFFYLASDLVGFTNFFGFAPDAVSGALNFNGDDAVELFRAGSPVDVFGNIAADGTGQAWEYLDGWAYRNNLAGQETASFLLPDWYFSGINVLDGESVNLTAAVPFPAGTFAAGPPSDPVPIPEPGTILLLGSGLGVLAGRYRLQGDRKISPRSQESKKRKN